MACSCHPAARAIRDQLRQFHFSERERLILEVVLEFSIEAGRPAARIPRPYFTALTGITKGNVSTTLERLVAKAVLVVEGELYRILPWSDLNRWMVAPRIQAGAWDAKRAELSALNGISQGELLQPEPSLKAARAAVCQDQDQAWAHGIEAARAAVERVPDSGTNPFPNREPGESLTCEKSNDLKGRVPDSGTALNVQRLTAIERLNDERLLVPESGTEAKLMSRIAHIVGPEDMAYWGGDWRKNWVRKHPKAVRSALGEWKIKTQTGWRPGNPGAAFKDLVRRFIT